MSNLFPAGFNCCTGSPSIKTLNFFYWLLSPHTLFLQTLIKGADYSLRNTFDFGNNIFGIKLHLNWNITVWCFSPRLAYPYRSLYRSCQPNIQIIHTCTTIIPSSDEWAEYSFQNAFVLYITSLRDKITSGLQHYGMALQSWTCLPSCRPEVGIVRCGEAASSISRFFIHVPQSYRALMKRV